MKELSEIEKMELAKSTMEALGFDFSEMTVAEAFEMFHAIKNTVSDKLAEQMEKQAKKRLEDAVKRLEEFGNKVDTGETE